jgi:hypothetical protein
MKRTTTLAALAAGLLAVAPAVAQPPRPQPPPPTPIAFRPAAEPVPALRYRLVPERRDLVRGNAALFYHRAIQFVLEDRMKSALRPAGGGEGQKIASEDVQVSDWLEKPIAELPVGDAKALLERKARVLREVELAVQRTDCDWEFDQRTEGVDMMLSEVQEMRTLARLVALRARLAVADRDFDAAMTWIRAGLTMGRHVSEGPSVIQALVGIAIDSVMLREATSLISAPGAPNLYWALADRPRPFVDMRRPLEGERYLLEKELPDLKHLDDGVWSRERARAVASDLERKLFTLAGGGQPGGEGAMPEFARRMGIAAMAAKVYPDAKKALVAQGYPAERVEAMPVLQVALLHTIREYARVRDDTYKWMNVPFWQSSAAMTAAEAAGMETLARKNDNLILALFRTLTPALNAARYAGVRLERNLDALQVVEAVRLHAASHGGTLPATLEEVTDVPVPIDPATGKPFAYTRTEAGALLEGGPLPAPFDHPSFGFRYELKPAD